MELTKLSLRRLALPVKIDGKTSGVTAEVVEEAVNDDSSVAWRTSEVPVAPPESVFVCWFCSFAISLVGFDPVAVVVCCEHDKHAAVDSAISIASTSVDKERPLHVSV